MFKTKSLLNSICDTNHAKSIATPEFNKFIGSILDKKLKQINLATNSDFNAVLQQANKNKEKIQKLATFDLSYFLGKTFLDDDGFKNKFAYQSTFNMLQLKKTRALNVGNTLEIKRIILYQKFFHYTIFYLS